jgi:CpeT protein
MKIIAFICSVACLAICACSAPAPVAMPEDSHPTPAGQGYLSLLVRFMTGTFETISQESRLGISTPQKLRGVPIWKDQSGAAWMYVEYAQAGQEEAPFRQRIYRFTESDGLITAAVFELPGDPRRFVGEWRKAAPFAGFTPADLRERPGCRIEFIPQMDVLFNGGRKGDACHGEFPGAHHDHAEFYLSSSTLRTHEDGRDSAGKHVSGPAGPSEFRKVLQMPG